MKLLGLLTCILLVSFESRACWCLGPKPLTKDILKKYPYVALVKVTGLEPFVSSGEKPENSMTAKFTVEVIENFKNPLPKELILDSYRTSCDIDLRPGQTWVIFAKVRDGQATVFACDYSIRHGGEQPVSDYENLRSQSAEELLNTVRQLTGKPVRAVGGRIEKFYANGRRALLTEYKSGGRQERTVWYANGRLRGREFYKDGVKHGLATCYNANGTPRSAETFLAGVAVDTSRHWYSTDTDTLWLQSTRSLSEYARDSILEFNRRAHIQSITIADRLGRLMHSRQYDWYGRLVDEVVGVPETGVQCRTSFDKQGNINLGVIKLHIFPTTTDGSLYGSG